MSRDISDYYKQEYQPESFNIWVSINEKKPEDGEILAFNAEYGEGHIHRAISVDEGDYICECETINSKRLYKVTHWMKMPEKPQ